VDDVDLIAILSRRSVHRALTQLARIVYPAVRCCIDLDDVEAGGSAPDSLARDAHSTRLPVFPLVLTVECHREHAGERRLPDAAGAAEEIAVRDASAGDCPSQRVRYVRLDGNGSEARWVVLAG